MTDTRSRSPISLQIFAVILIALGLVPVANLLSGGHAVPWWPAAVAEWTTTGLGVLTVAILVALLLGERLDRFTERAQRLLLAPSAPVFAIGAAALVLILAGFLARYCFAGQGFTGDEMAQRWHAQMLLAGRLFLPAESHREFFSTPTVVDAGGRWYSQFPIGGPAFLALGVLLRAAWLVNPVLAAVTAANVYRFAARAFDEMTARAGTLLFALSPFVLIMSASQMNHVATLALVSFALAELPAWTAAVEQRSRLRAALIIGTTLGVATMVRPLDGAIAVAAIGIFQLTGAGRDRARWSSLALQCAAGAIPIAILLWTNARTTGSPFLFAYDALNGPGHGIGFHADPSGAEHTPLRALVIMSGYLMKLNRYLFEWPLPALLVIVATLFAGQKTSRWELLLVGLTLAVIGGYAAYWFDGFFAGPRFLYLAMPAFVLFASRMPGAVMARLWGRPRWQIVRRSVPLLLPLCVVYAWLVPTGVSSVQMRAFYYRELRSKLKTDVEQQIVRARDESALDHALVFVRESWHARLVARLRALDMAPVAAERLLDRGDACALQTALDAEDTREATNAAERLTRVLGAVRAAGPAQPIPGLPAENRIAIVPGSRPTAACLREVAMDEEGGGTMPYALFLAQQEIDADGRLGGRIVFVRDLGPRNELLRARFGDRTWYRYRAPRSLADKGPVFVRYEALGAVTGR